MIERIIATVAFAFLVLGVINRKNRPVHVACMATGIGIDTVLVLALQVQRNVIQDAMTETYSLIQSAHILTSSTAFALYFPVVFLGLRQLSGKGSLNGRRWHIRIALTAFVLRGLGFLLMFSF